MTGPKVTLTDAEKALINSALRTAWRDEYSVAKVVDGICPAAESIAAAHVAEALRDVARFVENVDADGELPTGEGVGAWDAAPDCLQELVSRYSGSGPSNGRLVAQHLRTVADEYDVAAQS